MAIYLVGGWVSRLPSNDSMGAIPIPSARRVGATGDEDLAYELARVVARELRSLGINMNMAPVADVMTNPDNPVIGSRAFGTTPELVATMVQATVRGYADEGIISVLKHFPGHGDTFEDTHYSSAVVLHDRERLEQIELVPFTAGISAGADAVLSGHMSVPALQGDNLPATFSSVILTDLLRGELGFEGVIITDALIMGALVHYYPESQVCRRAFMAGADLLLRSPAPLRDADDLLQALMSGEISEERINESVMRIIRLKFLKGLMVVPDPEQTDELFMVPEVKTPEQENLGSGSDRILIEEVYRRSS